MSLAETVAAVEAQVLRKDGEIAGLKVRIAELQAALDKAVKSPDSGDLSRRHKAEIDRLRAELASTSERLIELGNRNNSVVQTSNEAIERHTTKINQLKEQLARQSTTVAAKDAEIGTLRAQRNTLRDAARVPSAPSEVVKDLHGEIAGLQAASKRLTDEKNDALARAQTLGRRADLSDQQLQELKQVVSKASADRSEALTKYKKLEIEKATISGTLEQVRQVHEDAVRRYEDRIAGLEAKLKVAGEGK